MSNKVVPEVSGGEGVESKKDETRKQAKPSSDNDGGEEKLGVWDQLKKSVRSLISGESKYHVVVDLDECDLDSEELEDFRMLTQFSEKEIKLLRVRFKMMTQDNEWMPKSKLFDVPELEHNPIKERIVHCFETDGDGFIDFREFITTLSHLSPKGSREKKLWLAFKIKDYDGDDKISKADLKNYLQDLTRITTKAEVEAARIRAKEESENNANKDVQARVAYNRDRVENLTKLLKSKENKKGKENEKSAGDADKSDNGDKPNASNKDKKELKEQIRLYTERIKFLESEGVIDKVVNMTFSEASANGEYLTREDFIRVVGHSDLQGKLTIDFCQGVKVINKKAERQQSKK